MGVVSNSSEEKVVAGITLYEGIAPVRVKFINPTQKELEEWGIKMQVAPKYRNIDLGGGNIKNKLVFWIEGVEADFKTRIELMFSPKVRTNKDGTKTQYINALGDTAWSDDKGTLPSNLFTWFSAEGERPAYDGEEKIMDLIKAWANVASGGNCSLDTIDSIVTLDDISELQELAANLSDNVFRVLLGVKDGKWQQVYTNHFGRFKPNNPSLFSKALAASYGEFNAAYPSNLEFREFTYEVPTPENIPVADADGGADLSWLND